MQYILSEEEYKELTTSDGNYKEKYKEAIEKVEKLNAKVLELNRVHCFKNIGFFCDNCPLSVFGTNTCTKEQKYYGGIG